MDHCRECEFVFADVSPSILPGEIRSHAEQLAALLRSEEWATSLVRRPQADVWSPLEYAAHVRDVWLNLRERVLLARVEDTPTFAPVHREERVLLARYNEQRAEDVAMQLVVAGELLAWLFDDVPTQDLNRCGVYGGQDRTVLWIGRQALHEARHHLQDCRHGLAAQS